MIGKSSDLFHRLTQQNCIASRVSHRIGGVSAHIDFPGKVILLVWNIVFHKQVILKKILIVKTLRRLHQTDFLDGMALLLCSFPVCSIFIDPFLCEKVRNRLDQKFSLRNHIRVKGSDQR